MEFNPLMSAGGPVTNPTRKPEDRAWKVEAENLPVRHAEKTRRALSTVLHPVVRIVLKNQNVKLASYGVDFLLARERQRGPRRIASDGNRVQDAWALHVERPAVPLGQHGPKLLWDDATLVTVNADKRCARGLQVQRTGERTPTISGASPSPSPVNKSKALVSAS